MKDDELGRLVRRATGAAWLKAFPAGRFLSTWLAGAPRPGTGGGH